MKRYGNLWDDMVSWPNLLRAARKAQRGKRDRAAVQRFNFDQETELLKLQDELRSGGYCPGPFHTHWIKVPKPRLISAAPYRDRVVHHALLNVLEPILDRHFHPHSYACRVGKGTHAAADRLQELMRRHRYALQCDVRKYFPSIDHEILKSIFRRLIKDDQMLALMDLIVDGSNAQEPVTDWFDGDDLFSSLDRRHGLPIGNLTSQWFANWYLTDLDFFATCRLGVGAYVRYCDDFVLLGDNRQSLWDAVDRIAEHLAATRRLRLHENRLIVRPAEGGVAFVGYRIWPTHRLVRKDNVHRFCRRVRWMRRAYTQRRIDWIDIKPRLVSWMGHARHANSERLIARLSREWVFARGRAENVACFARRFVEQQPEQLPRRQPQQEHARQPEQQHRVPCCPALAGQLACRPESPRSRMRRAWRGESWLASCAAGLCSAAERTL